MIERGSGVVFIFDEQITIGIHSQAAHEIPRAVPSHLRFAAVEVHSTDSADGHIVSARITRLREDQGPRVWKPLHAPVRGSRCDQRKESSVGPLTAKK